jgi:glutathione S-transferase
LEELNARYELKVLNLKKGAQRDDAYRRINPMMKVPSLVDDNIVVTETGAILQYVAERVPSPCLIPPLGDPARPNCLRWLFFVCSCLEPAMGEKFNGWTPNPYYNGWGDFERVREVIAAGLRTGPWLLGDTFTVADIYLASDLRIARAGELIATTEEPFVGYLKRIENRPSFRRASGIDADVTL